MSSLIAASVFFLLIHFGVSGTRLRDALVARIGEGRYRAVFALASVVGIVWMSRAYARAPTIELWGQLIGMRPLVLATVFIAFLFVGIGLATPSPTRVGMESKLAQGADIARGIVRITRHPFLWGVALWAFVHLIVNGDLASVILFGSLFVLALGGTAAIDAKRRRVFGNSWNRFAQATSNIPFAAIATGRNELSAALREIGILRPIAAIAAFALLLVFHSRLFGATLGVLTQNGPPPSYQTILDDPLAGDTLGTRTGGRFVVGGGWQSVDNDNMIVYDLGQYIESGSLELDVRNFDPKIQNSALRHHFLAMFRNPWGNHHPADNSETVWDLHAGKRYKPGIKMLSWTYVEDESETVLRSPTWSANQTYHLKITWQGEQLNYYRDGMLYATHEHSEAMQLRFIFLGRDLTVSGDLITDYKDNQYPALVGPIYANLVVKGTTSANDYQAPVVSAVGTSALYANAARLSWETDEPTTCRVEYGVSPDLENSTSVLGLPAAKHETTLAGLAANHTYYFRVVAQDREGNVTITPSYSFTTDVAGNYLFKPVADTFVEADGIYGPTRSYGNFGWMHLLLSSGRQAYLRFEVAGISGKPINAVLRVHGRQSGSGGDVKRLASIWDELGVTWRKKPTIDGRRVGNLPDVSVGEWSEVSVISAVNGNATYSFAIIGSDTQVASLDSRESLNFQPELIVSTSDE